MVQPLHYWFNTEIQSIWENYFPNDFTNLFPQIYSPFTLNPDILFIGLNPSFPLDRITKRIATHLKTAEQFQLVMNTNEITEEAVNNYYTFNPTIENLHDYTIVMALERTIAIEEYAYYNPHREIEQLGNFTWHTCDLYQNRNTSAGNLPKANKILKEFFLDQLDIISNFIHNLNPRLIIVSNLQASRYFQPKKFELDIEIEDEIESPFFENVIILNNELNCDVPHNLHKIFQIRKIIIDHEEPIPIIFSHQFTGGAFMGGVSQLHPFIIDLLH